MNDSRARAVAALPGEIAARVAATIRPEIRALSAYAVAKAEGMIKLDAMENPYALPAEVRARLASALAEVPINRYPDGGSEAPKRALRSALPLADDVGLMVGNGSDELLQLVTIAVARPGAVVLAPEPTFVMYRLYAVHANARYVGVSLAADFALDLSAMLAAIERSFPAGTLWTRPEGGLFVWVSLPRGLDAEELLGDAMRDRVAFVPGAPFYPAAPCHETLRLNFSNRPPVLIAEGIARLGACVSARLRAMAEAPRIAG